MKTDNNNNKVTDSLPTLKAIQIQTIDMCNRSCEFCPNKFGLRKTGTCMKYSVFRQILECLREIAFKGRISPYLMNEPLLDPRLPTWISNIRADFPQNIIFINTNGDAIGSESLRENLAESGLDGMQINCYDGEGEFRKKLKIVERWAEKDDRILVHYSGSLRKMDKRNGRLNVRVIDIHQPLETFWNRGGHLPLVKPSKKYGQVDMCLFPFEQMYINHLGQVIICCSDYKFEVVLGSIIESSLADIWEGKAYRELRRRHIIGDFKDLLLCRACNRIIADGS